MAYDEQLADRVREALGARSDLTERRMFGGIAWMVSGNMACGVLGDEVIVRLEREEAERALGEPDVRPFDMTGRQMGGFAVVGGAAIADDAGLARWVDAGANHAASLPPRRGRLPRP